MERKSETVFVTLEEIREQLKEADEALPEDIKREYPAESFEEIKKKHKNRWVAFLTTDINEKFFPSDGRVIATAGRYDRPLLEEQVRPLEERAHRVLSIFYTGEYDFFDKEVKDVVFDEELKDA